MRSVPPALANGVRTDWSATVPVAASRSGTVLTPSPLGEGRGEGLVRRTRINSPGFSPLSRTSHQSIPSAVHVCEEFLNGLRAEARSNVVVAVCAQALTVQAGHRLRFRPG